MIRPLLYMIYQTLARQSLRRQPEMDMLMADPEQDSEYNAAGSTGPLASVYELVVSAARRHAPADGEALDICCGSGQLLARMAQAMPDLRMTGLDLSTHMLEHTKNNVRKLGLTNVDVVSGSMYELEKVLAGRKFDFISWNLALHHCDHDQDVVRVFNQIQRLRKPGSGVLIFDIHRPKTGGLALAIAATYNGGYGDWFFQDSLDSYKAGYTYDELNELLQSSEIEGARHVRQLFANLFQAIVVTSARRRTKQFPTTQKLGFGRRLDYLLLKTTFASCLRTTSD